MFEFFEHLMHEKLEISFVPDVVNKGMNLWFN